VDGNLFLVFWLGNMVGSRDVESPDGDHRFFKEKLDELPQDLVREVRRRNARYIVWLAEQLARLRTMRRRREFLAAPPLALAWEASSMPLGD
jgi:hypothetical protein